MSHHKALIAVCLNEGVGHPKMSLVTSAIPRSERGHVHPNLHVLRVTGTIWPIQIVVVVLHP